MNILEQVYLATEKGVLYSNISGGSQNATQEILEKTNWLTIPASEKKAGIKIVIKDYGLVAIAVDSKANVFEILLQGTFSDDGTISQITTHETPSNGSILSNINTLGTIVWTDGARTLHFKNNTLISQEHTDDSINSVLSQTEEIFKNKKIIDIQITKSGIIEVTTDENEIIELT